MTDHKNVLARHYNHFRRSSKGVVRAVGLDHHRDMISIRSFLRSPWFWAVALILPPTLLPAIDLAVSSWFFDPVGRTFPLRETPWAEWVRRQWPLYMLVPIALIPLAGLWGEIRKRPIFGLTRPVTLFLILSLAIGPGLAINLVLKDHWGRPRPGTVTQFGGSNDFRPPVLPGGPCPKNCAFPSGHASLAFWLVAPASLAPARRRRPAIVGALFCGLLIGFVRIAEGGHFLSDVLYAGLITCGITHILYKLLIIPSKDRVTKS